MGEAESLFAHVEQQRGVEIGTAGHGCLGESADGEVLALRRTFAQMVAGGGEDLVGVGGHGEGEFDLVHVHSAFADVDDFRMLADQAGFVEFAGPDELHPLFRVLRGDGDGRGALGFGRDGPVRVAVLFGHVVGVARCNGFRSDVGDLEFAEQLHAVAAHVEARGTDPGFGLRRQHAWPCGVVEFGGDALRRERVEHVDHGFRRGERPAPMHESRQIVTGEDEREGDVRGRLFGVDGGEPGAVG